jgi:hypothetical protein
MLLSPSQLDKPHNICYYRLLFINHIREFEPIKLPDRNPPNYIIVQHLEPVGRPRHVRLPNRLRALVPVSIAAGAIAAQVAPTNETGVVFGVAAAVVTPIVGEVIYFLSQQRRW